MKRWTLLLLCFVLLISGCTKVPPTAEPRPEATPDPTADEISGMITVCAP